MCILETIWETTEWNCTKKNKCLIKGIIRWKYLRNLIKLLKYNLSKIKENCFSETKELFKWNKK